MALTEAEVKTYYQAILQREPTDAQLAVAMATGTADTLISALIDSNESQSFVFPLIQVYQAVFNRVPDAAGLDFWVDAYRAGTSLEDITAGFVASEEFQNTYGNVTDGSDPAFIQQLYINVLGRPGEPAGIAFWTSQTGISPAEVVRLFATDVEFTNRAADPIAEFLADAAKGVDGAYDGSLFAPGFLGNEFSLTIGEDSGAAFTGGDGNDIFNAPVVQDNIANPVNTLENIDVLDGGAGTDTLNATISGADAAPILKSIENINVRFASGNQLDLSNATGVTSVTVHNSTDAGTVAGVGSVSNLAVKSQTQDATFTDNTASSLNLTLDTFGAAAANTVTLDTGALGLNLTTNNTNAVIAGLASAETLTVAATGKNTIDLSATAGTLKTATVTGSGSVNLSAATLGALTTLTATDNTGGVTVKVDDTATKVSTGSGADSVTYTAALAATAAVNLGAGNDTFTIAAASAKGAVVNAGEGSDTLAVADGAWLNADAKTVYTGFETLEIGGGTGNYDMDNLPGLTAVTIGAALTGATNIQNAAAGTTVTVNASKADLNLGNALTYALKTATGTTDAVTLALTGTEAATANGAADGEITVTSFDADGIETFNIVSNISGFEVEAGNNLKNTSYTHTITTLDGDAVQTINISGNANLTVTNLASTTVTKINASTATGEVTIDASGVAQAVEFLGGSADDTYTGTDGGDTINAGKGADAITLTTFNSVDTLIFAAGDSVLNATAGGHDVVTGFGTAAGAGALDVIDLGAFNFTGQQASALANKGALASSVVDGSTLTQTDFFLSGGVDRGVAIGTNGGDTYIFVDVNQDGDFNAANDLFIQLTGVTDVTLANFGF